MSIYITVAIGLWVAFFAYWGISAFSASQAAEREDGSSRALHLLFVGGSFFLVTGNWLNIPWLGVRWLPDLLLVIWVGIAIEALGLAFAVWARYHLGQYWSGTITIKQDHRLIQTGPYRWMRHPIYTGFVLGIAGTALSLGEVRGLLAIALILLAYLRKIHMEERFLRAEFGDDYALYRQHVKALIPFIY